MTCNDSQRRIQYKELKVVKLVKLIREAGKKGIQYKEFKDMSILIKLTRYIRSALLTYIEEIACIMLTIDRRI